MSLQETYESIILTAYLKGQETTSLNIVNTSYFKKFLSSTRYTSLKLIVSMESTQQYESLSSQSILINNRLFTLRNSFSISDLATANMNGRNGKYGDVERELNLTALSLCADISFHIQHCGESGFGVFTPKTIARRTKLLVYYGDIISTTENKKRQSIYDAQGLNYVLCIREESMLTQTVFRTNIDATDKGGIARFVNHSCEPNCEIYLHRSGQGQIVPIPVIESLRLIQKGEQLTIDYGSINSGFEKSYQSHSRATHVAQTRPSKDYPSKRIRSMRSTSDDRHACGDASVDFARNMRPLYSPGDRQCFCGSERCRGYLPFDPKI